jgi:hypothetical protein
MPKGGRRVRRRLRRLYAAALASLAGRFMERLEEGFLAQRRSMP